MKQKRIYVAYTHPDTMTATILLTGESLEETIKELKESYDHGVIYSYGEEGKYLVDENFEVTI